ncbi:FKBP-type peptidyl-prolyl cis-trans isomerase [Mycobacterium sp. NPDC003323]
MNTPRLPAAVTLVACAAALATTLAACGSDTDTPAASTSTSSDVFSPPSAPAVEPTATEQGCPSTPPQSGGTPEWTLSGATGSVAVIGSTDTAAPSVTVEGPFSVTETQVQTLKPGDGPVVAENATVLVCYMGVNGRDGSVFDSSYQMGAPVDFPLDGVVTGFQKAIAGQTVGSTVAVAMTPEDGYPEGQPAAGIHKGDTLVFAIKILDAMS